MATVSWLELCGTWQLQQASWHLSAKRNNKPMSYPQQLGRSWKVFVPEPSRTLFAMCTGTLRNLISHRRNLACNLRRSPPEPHRPSAPEPAGTLFAICTGTIRNHPDPHQPSAPEPSRTSSAFCTGTLWNLISFLHRNPLELSGTLRNLLRNLGLQLHRIAPELF